MRKVQEETQRLSIKHEGLTKEAMELTKKIATCKAEVAKKQRCRLNKSRWPSPQGFAHCYPLVLGRLLLLCL
eukprot:9083424-Prorocentrum_lima.AAC.1